MLGMQDKTVKKTIRKKVDDWLSTIDDPDLQQSIKRDLIVTGGSIASMLMGDRINDYDLYFRTKETTKKVAEYYTDKFKKMHPNMFPKPEVREESLVNLMGDVEDRVVIWVSSHGAIREEGYVDREIEDQDPDNLEQNDEEQDDRGEKYRPVFLSENAITLSHKVQIITRFYGDPDKIHSNYDFVHAMCYYDYKPNELSTPVDAIRSMQSKTLKYKGSLYPICSLFRMRKFINRGWKISAGEILKIALQISHERMDLTNVAILREQLTGVDQLYMHTIVDAVKNGCPDDETPTIEYISEIVDRVFSDG